MANEQTGEMSGTTNPNLPKVKWDDANMKSSYANVCNVTSTREEVILLFHRSQSIRGQANGQPARQRRQRVRETLWQLECRRRQTVGGCSAEEAPGTADRRAAIRGRHRFAVPCGETAALECMIARRAFIGWRLYALLHGLLASAASRDRKCFECARTAF
jgi:hypothetical protein